MNNEPDYKNNLVIDPAKTEIQLNGIFFAIDQLNRAMKAKDYRVYDYVSEAITTLEKLLK